MAWRVEAWTIPGVGTFSKLIGDIPVTQASFNTRIGWGQGKMTVPADYTELATLLDPNVSGSLIRYFWDTVPKFEFEVDKFTLKAGEQSIESVVFEGDDILGILNRAVLYAFDYPTKPTIDPDWKWGLSDPAGSFTNGEFDAGSTNINFEDQAAGGFGEIRPSSVYSAVVEDTEISDVSPIAGTYSMTFTAGVGPSGLKKEITVKPGERYQFSLQYKDLSASGARFTFGASLTGKNTIVHHTNGFTFNGIAKAELGNVAEGAGATDGAVQTINLDVTVGSGPDPDDEQKELTLYVLYEDAVAAPEIRIDTYTQVGDKLGLEPWEPRAIRTATVDVFQLNGTALEFQVTTGASSPPIGGVFQPVTGLTDGRMYTFSGEVESPTATTVRIIISRIDANGWLASTAVSLAAGVPKEFSLSIPLTATDGSVFVEVRYDGVGTSPLIKLNNALWAEGQGAANVGTQWQAVLNDAAVDHVGDFRGAHLDWLKFDSFDGVNDSAGVPWSGNEAVTLTHGMKYADIASVYAELGYEQKIVWDPIAVKHSFEVYGPHDIITHVGGMGTDKSADDTVAIISGSLLTEAPIERFRPGSNAVLAEGAEGIWTEQTDSSGSIPKFGGGSTTKATPMRWTKQRSSTRHCRR